MLPDILVSIAVISSGPILFYWLFRKDFVDPELKNAALIGLFAGMASVIVARLFYYPVEMFLGTGLKEFLQAPREWYIVLAACIVVVGFIEESAKAIAGWIAAHQANRMKRPGAIFLAFAAAAIGFSALENFQYFSVFGIGVLVPRLLISSSAHLFFSCICGFMAASSFPRGKSNSTVSVRILFGIVLASVLHGFFNFLIFRVQLEAISGLLVALAALFIFAIYELWLRILKFDLPKEENLTVCAACGAFAIGKNRFCNFCGSRVLAGLLNTEIKISQNNE